MRRAKQFVNVVVTIVRRGPRRLRRPAGAIVRRTQMTRPNGLKSIYAYDNLSRLTSVLHQSGSTTLDGAAYGLDNAG